MEQRSFFLKTAIVLVFAFAWMQLAQVLFPQFFQNPQNAQQQPPAAAQPADELAAEDEGAFAAEPKADPNDAAQPDADPPLEAPRLDLHPHKKFTLGSLEPESGYFELVELSSAGAAVESVQLNDPRYARIDDRNEPLKVVGNNLQSTDLRTLQTSVDLIDAQLRPFDTSLAEVDWEIVPGSRTENEVTFRYRAPDDSLEIRKHYRLNAGNPDARDSDPLGYQLELELEIKNLSGQTQEFVYTLQGPVGLPLEDQDNSREYIELKAGTLEDASDPTSVSAVEQTAASVVDQMAEAVANPAAVETWKSPLKYVGVDVQYFAALIFPQENQLDTRWFSEARPELVSQDSRREEWSDVSVVLESVPVALKSKETLDHHFRVYFGPKRSDLLEPLGAGGVKDFGWFGIISRGMLAVLNFFHHTLYAPYGIAIIMLTVVVRACLFPISRKMAQNQQRMKELQPKMQEIRTKYKDDQEKMAQAYREFMAKNGFNPLAGCLPMFLQLPIFIGLYQALYNSVDLRMARFLWIDNLAAPDQLFAFGFTIPFLGWTHFNVLPLITVVLFVFQQKMFMPPPTSEEQAMQYKMMNFFTIFIGFMFYRVPAGLCVYFIASSLWGICERKLLDWTGATSSDPSLAQEGTSEGGRDGGGDGPTRGPRQPDDQPKPPGLFQRLVEAADQAKNSTNGNTARQAQAERRKTGKNPRKGRKSKPRR